MVKCEPASEPLARHLDVYSDRPKITAKNSKRKPHTSDFCDLLEKHLQFLLDNSWAFQNIFKMLLNIIRLFFLS